MIIWLAILSSLATCWGFGDRDHLTENARLIYARLERGRQPEIRGGPTRYFTGPCIVLSANLDPQGSYFALVGLAQTPDGARATWYMSYQSNTLPAHNGYVDLSEADLNALYPPIYPALVAQQRWRSEISRSPALFFEVAQDPTVPGRLYLAGSHIGTAFCVLESLTQDSPGPSSKVHQDFIR